MTTPKGTSRLRHWAVDYSIMVQKVVWEDKTGDAYWSPVIASWSGSYWESVYAAPLLKNIVYLSDAGSWANGYVPASLRVSFTGSVLDIGIYDSDGVAIGEKEGAVSGELILLEVLKDVHSAMFGNALSSFTVTKIEFSC